MNRQPDDTPVDQERREIYVFGQFRVDVGSLRLFRDGDVVPLTPKVFDTLLVLIRHRNRVVSKDELIRTVWREVTVSEDSLSQSISALRRALGDDPIQHQYVATVPRRGYRFVADVTEINDPPSHGVAGSDTSEATPALRQSIAPVSAERLGTVAATRRTPLMRRALLVAILGLIAVVSAVVGYRQRPMAGSQAGGPLRFTVQAPPDTTIESSAILSPDSRRMVFAAQDASGRTQLWVRELDGADAHPLPGTDGASRPFWSPDGQSLGFFAAGALKKVSLGADPPQTLANADLSAGGGTWGSAGVIVYAGWRSGLYAVPAEGGTPTSVTTLDSSANEAWHMSPQFLPDGRHFLFNAASGDPAKAVTYVGSLDSRDRVRLDVGNASFAAPSYLLYVRERTLMAQPFDPDRIQLVGQPRTVVGNVTPPDRAGAISATAGGLLSFGGGIGDARFVWVDRDGQVLRSVEAPVTLHQPAFSRDRKMLLASGGSGGGRGVWSVDLDRSATTRLTDGGTTPTSAPDGTAIAFTSDRLGGVFNIYLRTVGRTNDELLLQTSENKIVYDWSPEGQYIVYGTTSAKTKKDIWLLPMRGDRAREPRPLFASAFNEIQAQVSPDGRWIAYASDESGRWDVYVQSFPDAGNKRVVSLGEGAQPQWRRDGRELYYLSATHRLIAVETDLTGDGRIGPSQPLFRAPVWGDLSTYRSQYLAGADGQQFLVDAFQAGNSRDPITVIVNWSELLNR